MNNKLIKEIYETFQEWKTSPDEFRTSLDDYVNMVLNTEEVPEELKTNYLIYWESLKQNEGVGDEIWNDIIEDIYRGGI